MFTSNVTWLQGEFCDSNGHSEYYCCFWLYVMWCPWNSASCLAKKRSFILNNQSWLMAVSYVIAGSVWEVMSMESQETRKPIETIASTLRRRLDNPPIREHFGEGRAGMTIFIWVHWSINDTPHRLPSLCYDYSFAINPSTLREYVSSEEIVLGAARFYRGVRFLWVGGAEAPPRLEPTTFRPQTICY